MDDGTELLSIISPLYAELLGLAYDDASAELSLHLAWDIDNPLIQNVLDELALRVKSIADTTRTEIQKLTGEATANGWGVEELAKRIRGLAGIHSRKRAKLIAVTETATAYSKGSLAAYEQSGIVKGTEWLITGGACAICQGLVGKVVPLGNAYAPGIYHPPAHPRCRCALIPVVMQGAT